MDFSFTEEQSMLRDTVASYLADHYSFDQRRAMLAKEPGWSPAPTPVIWPRAKAADPPTGSPR